MHPDPVPEEPNQGRHSPRPSRLPLYGCAFNGAATTAVHLTDAVVIVHGPGACAFYTLQNITSTGRKNLFNRGILMPSALNPHFEGTDIGQTQAVFGGMDSLREKVREALDRKPGAVIVISSCVSGIIGDDIRSVEDLSTEDTPVITIAADGVLAGDYMEGIRLCMDALAERLIDPDVKPEGRRVNLINETGVSNHIEFNFRVIEDLLSQMDVEVNCRYLGDAAADQMKYFLRAPLNLLASSTEDSLKRRKWLEDAYGCRFLEQPFPIGFGDACLWLRQIGAFFGREQKAEEIIEKEKTVYQQGIRRFRPLLENRTILLTTINASLDWLLEAVVAAGMRILWIGVLNYLNQDLCVTAHPEYCGEIVSGYDWSAIRDKVRELSPDLVLSNYTSLLEEGDYIQDSLPMMPAAGFHSALPVLERWTKLLETGKEGTWKDDRALFDECYS